MEGSRQKNIQGSLLKSFSALAVAVVIISLGVFYAIFISSSQRQMEEVQLNLCRRVAQQLEIEIDRMDDAAKRIIFSTEIKRLFYETFPEGRSDLKYENRLNLAEEAVLTTGVIFQVRRINLIDSGSRKISIEGYVDFQEYSGDAASVSWPLDLSVFPGRRALLAPYRSPEDGKYVISVVRNLALPRNQSPYAYVEIQQSYGVFERILESNEETRNAFLKVYLFDEQGQLIYPLTLEKGDEISRRYYEKTGEDYSRHVNSWRELRSETVAGVAMDKVGWNVVLVQSAPLMEQEIGRWCVVILAGGVLLIFIALAASFKLAGKLARPIAQVHRRVLSMNPITLEDAGPCDVQRNEFVEVRELDDAFTRMMDALRESADAMVNARSSELQAKLLALQSQMNPHFLYNTLSAIGVMAEDEGAQQSMDMLMALSQMLAYISDGNLRAPVAMETELEHTMNFIALLKIRYEDQIDVKLDIQPEMMEIRVPKLILQPIVENWSKYGMVSHTQATLAITGRMEGAHWTLCVEDNGEGFSEEALATLHTQMKAVMDAEKIPDLKIHKMGLFNIFIRMHYAYGQLGRDFVFEVGNRPEGGGRVRIGGTYYGAAD